MSAWNHLNSMSSYFQLHPRRDSYNPPQLTFIVQNLPVTKTQNFPDTVEWLRQNLQHNINVLQTMDSLVALHSNLTYALRRKFSSLLRQKYPYTDFRQQMKKLAAINSSLIEPYLFVLSRISEWHQLQTLSQQHESDHRFEISFMLAYLRTLVIFQFQTGKIVAGVGTWETLVSIYNLIMQQSHLLLLIQQEDLKSLAVSIFYFLANSWIADLRNIKTMFSIIGTLVNRIEEVGINFQDQVLSQMVSIIRLSGRFEREQIVESIQNGVRGLLCIKWSLDKESQWSWICKMIWDLIEIQPKQQAALIKDGIESARELLRHLESL